MVKSNFISKIVFIFSFSIFSFSLISVVFPALIVRMTSGASFSEIEPFEFGFYAIPLLISNSIFFLIYYTYKKNKLKKINILTDFLKTIDISRKQAFAILVIILSVYSTLAFHEIFEPEDTPDLDYVVNSLDKWGIYEDLSYTISQYHVKLFFLYSSNLIFGNIRLFPFLISIALLALTFFYTNKITSKNYTGLISVLVVLQSFIFREYDSIITYSNFWVFFYLLSIYLIHKAWPLSFLSFLASFFSKPLTIMYVPLNIFYICMSSFPLRNKLLKILPYLLIVVALVVLLFILAPQSTLQSENIIIHPPRFFSGFTILPYQLRFDLFIMMGLLPLTFLLYKKSLQGHKHADSIQILISGILLTGPMLVGILNYQLNPYRLQPLIIFFSIGVGLLFSNKIFRNN
jgi:hypothetical protein